MQTLDNRYKRGTIWEVDLGRIGEEKTSVQKGKRPCLIVSNDVFNQYAPVVHVVAITSKAKPSPVHVEIPTSCGLKHTSYALFEQIYTVDKDKILNYIGQCTEDIMAKCDVASKIQNGIVDIKYIWDLVDRIIELDEWIQVNNMMPEFMIRYRNALLYDLRNYCEQLGKDYNKILDSRRKIRGTGAMNNGRQIYWYTQRNAVFSG